MSVDLPAALEDGFVGVLGMCAKLRQGLGPGVGAELPAVSPDGMFGIPMKSQRLSQKMSSSTLWDQGLSEITVAASLLWLVHHEIHDRTGLMVLSMVEQLDQSHGIESKSCPSVYIFNASIMQCDFDTLTVLMPVHLEGYGKLSTRQRIFRMALGRETDVLFGRRRTPEAAPDVFSLVKTLIEKLAIWHCRIPIQLIEEYFRGRSIFRLLEVFSGVPNAEAQAWLA